MRKVSGHFVEGSILWTSLLILMMQITGPPCICVVLYSNLQGIFTHKTFGPHEYLIGLTEQQSGCYPYITAKTRLREPNCLVCLPNQ